MYYSELTDCIKYKTIRGPKKILERILENHNSKTWAPIDYTIYQEDNNYAMIIEKTQEEIVDEIKNWVRNNLGKLNLTLEDRTYLLSTLELCTYVCDFERLEEYFKLSDVYPECFYTPKEYKPVIVNGEKAELPDIDDIKRIDILLILDKLGIQYKRIGHDTYALYENGKWTDGWRANTTKNIVSDFSGKGRAHGNPFHFVSMYLNLDNKETLLWFKNELGL